MTKAIIFLKSIVKEITIKEMQRKKVEMIDTV